MDYSYEYKYYLKHVKLWNKIAELLENRDKRIFEDGFIGAEGTVGRLKALALEDLGYKWSDVHNGCFACEAVHGCIGSCILLWDEDVITQKAYSCERGQTPYLEFTHNASIGEDIYPWETLRNLAKEVSNIPFNDKEYSKYKSDTTL